MRIWKAVIIAVALAALVFSLPACSGKGKPAEEAWVTSLDKGLRTAKAENKLVLVDFTATWCAPCQKYIKEVFPTPEFARAAEGFVLVKIDIDEHPDLAKRFRVDGIPDIKVLDADGNVVDTLVGFGGAEPLIAMMEKAKGA